MWIRIPEKGKVFMAEHNETGSRGEEIAVRHLRNKSYTILERNWRTGRLEVDIIARLDNQLVIAEVKTRNDGFLESLAEAVNKRKQNLLSNLQQSLKSLNPIAVLNRGFAIVTRTEDDALIKNTKQVHIDDAIHIQVSQGSMDARITKINSGE